MCLGTHFLTEIYKYLNELGGHTFIKVVEMYITQLKLLEVLDNFSFKLRELQKVLCVQCNTSHPK